MNAGFPRRQRARPPTCARPVVLRRCRVLRARFSPAPSIARWHVGRRRLDAAPAHRCTTTRTNRPDVHRDRGQEHASCRGVGQERRSGTNNDAVPFAAGSPHWPPLRPERVRHWWTGTGCRSRPTRRTRGPSDHERDRIAAELVEDDAHAFLQQGNATSIVCSRPMLSEAEERPPRGRSAIDGQRGRERGQRDARAHSECRS